MILTVTPNPSLDRTLVVDDLRIGEVHRARGGQVEPSGKGVNVSRALAVNGVPTLAVLPLGGPEGDHLRTLLDAEGVRSVAVGIAGSVRVNVSIAARDGRVTKVNAPGPQLTAAEVAAVEEAVVREAATASWVVGSGSLPRGVPEAFYGELCARMRAGAPVRRPLLAVDTSGTALRQAVAAGPDLLKPNREELAELAGSSLTSLGAAGRAAEQVRRAGVRTLLVSLGADGALLVDDHGWLHARARAGDVRSPVGAGDNLLAGYLAGWRRDAGPDGRATLLREAVAWASVAVRSAGSLGAPVTDDDRALVDLTDTPDVALALTDG